MQRERQVRLVIPDTAVVKDHRGYRAPQDHKAWQATLAYRALQASPAAKELLEPWAVQAILAIQGQRELPVPRDTLEHQVGCTERKRYYSCIGILSAFTNVC